MLWKIIFLIIGLFCLAYYVLICVSLRKWNSTFSRFWLGTGMVCIAGELLLQRYEMPAFLKGVFIFVVIAFLATESVIIAGMFQNQQMNCHYLIVLGAQVSGRNITDSLQRRLDKAFQYLRNHPDTIAIVSGGKGKGEDITEAEAMAGYLNARGIEEERIILEKRSRTTRENLKYSYAFVENAEEPVGIVSNQFHLYRACSYAKRLGYKVPCPIAAGCRPLLVVNYMVRECLAVWKMWLL